jgi:hypothetical protein
MALHPGIPSLFTDQIPADFPLQGRHSQRSRLRPSPCTAVMSRHDGTLAGKYNIYSDADAPQNDYIIARVVIKPAQTGTMVLRS